METQGITLTPDALTAAVATILNPTPWTQEEAIKLCTLIESVCPKFGCHVALTGGLLYREGPRKDCDVVLYRIRQVKQIDLDGLWQALGSVGIHKYKGWGWCYKALYQRRGIDILFPEEQSGENYPS